MRSDLRESVGAVLDALPYAALIVAGDGRSLLRNAEADRLLPAGGDLDAVLGAGGAGEVEWAAEVASLRQTGEGRVRRGVLLAGRAEGQVIADVYLRLIGRLGAADEAEEGRVLVVVEDVSGQMSTQRQLAAGERLHAAGTLAAKVAHELNNPLDGALRFVGLAERVAGAQAARYLAQARGGLMRMAEIIRGLLEQGRPWRAAGERTAVRHLLDEAIQSMQPRAQALGVAIVCDSDDGVTGSTASSVFQVFCNVIKNALDAMGDGGILTVVLRRADGGCDIEFSDTGHGLSDAEVQRVFEPFYSTKPPAEGSGLGLTISREIVRRLGGTIGAHSGPDSGLVVCIRLPLHATWPASQQETER